LIVIDGSMGEGGGQILRTALGLSAVLGKPIRIINIRAGRPNPGLRRQHMIAVKAVAAISNARVRGLRLGSTVLEFEPDGLRSGRFRFDIGTAGSVTLVFQALMPVLPFVPGPVEVELRGGTDVPWSPPIDYVRFVLSRLLERFGFRVEVELYRRGHYPRGGGRVVFRVAEPPGRLRAVSLVERGEVRRVEGLSHAVRLPRHVAERQARAAMELLRSRLSGVPVHVDVEWYEPSRDRHLGPGSGVVVWALTEHSVLGGDSLGARGKRAEVVGEEAAKKLLEDLETGMALDRHASDMLFPIALLACGESLLGGARLTMHAYTNMEVARIMAGDRGVVELVRGGEREKPFVARVRGLCLQR